MTRKLLVGIGALAVSLAVGLYAEAPAEGTAPNVSAPAEGPVDGFLCVTDEGTASPELLPAGGGDLFAQMSAAPPCPVNFSDCEDVPGRKCGLQNCETVDLGYDKCKKNNRVIRCRNGNLQQTTCDCLERLHLVCCDLGNCSFGECGECTGGSLTTECP